MKWHLALLYFLALPVFSGTFYKTVDANGKTIYTDQAPTKDRVVETFKFNDPPPAPAPQNALRRQAEPEKNPKARAAESAKPTTLFAAAWCGYCRSAKAYLSEKGISYREYDIDTDDGRRALNAAGFGRAIPILQRNGKTLQGFSRGAYDSFFSN